MTIYKFEAVSTTGIHKSGYIQAESVSQAALKVKARKLVLIKLTISYKETLLQRCRYIVDNDRDRVIFFRQAGLMLGAGMNIGEVLMIISRSGNKNIAAASELLLGEIRGGHSLSGAMGLCPEIFSPEIIAMTAAGEMSGCLEGIFSRLADSSEKSYLLQKRLKSMLAYPVILLILSSLLTVFMLYWIMPVVLSMLEGSSMELPVTTRALILITDTLRQYGWGIAAIFMLGALLAVRLYQNKGIKMVVDRGICGIAFLGKLKCLQTTAIFLDTVALMLQSGIVIDKAVASGANTSSNVFIRERFLSIANSLERGFKLQDSLSEISFFPAFVKELLAAGEVAGELERMLQYCGDACRQEAEILLQRLESLAEPVVILVLGAVVGFLVISIISPIMDMMSAFY